LERGAQIPELTYRQILKERPAHAAAVKAAFNKVDALLVPILPNVTPLQSEGPEVWALGRRFNLPFSFIGVPSISIPCGFAEGMPVGLQIVANDLQEAFLLRVGAAFESVTDHHLQRPTVA
jgi:aspartyl-tRNA(Asn)/glutamyl-tRNA(Gln) amidotransferase subunit A